MFFRVARILKLFWLWASLSGLPGAQVFAATDPFGVQSSGELKNASNATRARVLQALELQALLNEISVPQCGPDEVLKRPEVRAEVTRNEQALTLARLRRSLVTSGGPEPLYTLPVVFHVIHLGEAVGSGTNISDAQIQSAVEALNNQFRKVPGSTGDGGGVDTNIQFVLAKRDPNGNPHSGINRVNGSSVPNYASKGITSSPLGTSAVEADVKALSTWPRTQYVNIWVVSEIDDNNGGSGIQGYAYFPFNSPIDGITLLSSAVGTIGSVKSYTNKGMTLTHEMGHFFGLYHTFQNTLACGSETSCSTEGDMVCDTPSTILSSSCSMPACGGSQQVQNYMDYTAQTCQNLFTQGQKDRMRTTLETLRPSLNTSVGGIPVNPLDLALKSSNLPPFLCDPSYVPSVAITNLGTSTVTSAQVRYRIDGGGWETVSFSGSLVTGAEAMVTLPAFPAVTPGVTHAVEFNVTSPNGGTDLYSANDSLSQSLLVPLGTDSVSVSFILDLMGHENTYQISTAGNASVIYSGGPFSDNTQGQVISKSYCLPAGCYEFRAMDSFGDGQAFPNGSYSVRSSLGTVLASGSGNWGASRSESFCLNGSGGGSGTTTGTGGTTTGGTTGTSTTGVLVDSTPPTVSLTTPASGTILNVASDARITLTASAVDNVGISRVDFYRGSSLIGSASSVPYSFSYSTSSLGNGVQTFTARALDLAGNSSVSSPITVIIDRTPPGGSLSAPLQMTQLSGVSTLSATANDSGLGIKRVDFYQGSTLIGSSTAAPYSYSWDVSAVPPGIYVLSAKIIDLAENVFIPSSVNVRIGTPPASGTAVGGVFSGAIPGCFTRGQLATFLPQLGCSSSCSAVWDVDGDGKLNHLELLRVIGEVCHD